MGLPLPPFSHSPPVNPFPHGHPHNTQGSKTVLLYCHDASFSVEKHPAFPMDQLPKECRRLLKQKPPAISVAPSDLTRISRQGGTTQLRSAKSRWGEVGGIWFDEERDTVVEKGLTNYCSFSPRYQWQLVTSEATTAAQLTLQLFQLADNLNMDMLLSPVPANPVVRDARRIQPVGVGSDDEETPLQNPNTLQLEYYIVDKDGDSSWETDVPIVCIKSFNEDLLNFPWKARVLPKYCRSVLHELERRDPPPAATAKAKRTEKQAKKPTAGPATKTKSIPPQPPTAPPAHRSAEFEGGSDFEEEDDDNTTDKNEALDMGADTSYRALIRDAKKKKGDPPRYLAAKCLRPDCEPGEEFGGCTHCSCDGLCGRGHGPGLCPEERVLGKKVKNARMKSGYQTQSYDSCSACTQRRWAVKSGKAKSVKMTKANYEHGQRRFAHFKNAKMPCSYVVPNKENGDNNDKTDQDGKGEM
jgi:hypothetical protein